MQTSNNIQLGDEVLFNPIGAKGKALGIAQTISGHEWITLEIPNQTTNQFSYHYVASKYCHTTEPAIDPIQPRSKLSLGDYVKDNFFNLEGIVVRLDYHADGMVTATFENPNLHMMPDLEQHQAIDTSLEVIADHPLSNEIKNSINEPRKAISIGDRVEHIISKQQGTVINIVEDITGQFLVSMSTNAKTNFAQLMSDLMLFKKV